MYTSIRVAPVPVPMASLYNMMDSAVWLQYRNPEPTKREILNVFATYRDLRPMLEPFVFNDGTQKDLINLQGTIPVSYKGNTYNIPVCIWILDTHPLNPPMVFIKPTSNMQIKPSRYVDANGKVDLPFLREWKTPQSDLLSLIQILIMTFGEECPVFSKVPPRPPPPYQAGGAHQPPAGGFPPYPTGSSGNMPMPSISGASTNSTPYPSYSGTSGGYPGSSFPPYPTQQPGYPPTSQNMFGGYPPASNAYQGNQQYPSYPYGSNPTPYPSSSYPATTTATTVTNAATDRPQTGTVTEEHIRASLLSAVEDKMKRKLREIYAQAQAEMDVLKKTQADLNTGKETLNKLVTDLKMEKDEIERNVQLLQQKDNELKEALNRMEGNSAMDIDKAVDTTTPLYRQLLSAFAEEQAIEDAIYYLGEALRKNVIDLEVFLKQVRELSRKQFMLRALIMKCREKAGLPPMA